MSQQGVVKVNDTAVRKVLGQSSRRHWNWTRCKPLMGLIWFVLAVLVMAPIAIYLLSGILQKVR